jgi:hypothetical protein
MLADEKRAPVRAVLTQLERLRGLYPRYRVVAWVHAMLELEQALYWGSAEDSERMVRRAWKVLQGTGYPQFSRKARSLRARVCLARAATLPPGREREALLRAALRDGPMRRGDGPLERGMSSLTVAGVHILRGRRQAARAQLDDAIRWLDSAEAKLFAAAARYCKGVLTAGESGAALRSAAAQLLSAEGVRDPQRWVAWSACGFRAALDRTP